MGSHIVASFFTYPKKPVVEFRRQPYADEKENTIDGLAFIPLAGFAAFLLMNDAAFVVSLAYSRGLP